MKFAIRIALAVAIALTLVGPLAAFAQPNGADARPTVRSLSDRCSGVVLAPGYVLTADHCVNAVTALRAGGPAGTVIARGDDRLDYAVLVFPQAEAQCPCVRVAAREAEVDEPVYVIGYPLGIAQIVTFGVSQGVVGHERMPFGRRLVTTAQVAGGNSGGGVFVFRDGEYQLVGLLVESHAHISFAVPLADLQPFLARAMPGIQEAKR
jgi:S1-C subfamily serine protease